MKSVIFSFYGFRFLGLNDDYCGRTSNECTWDNLTFMPPSFNSTTLFFFFCALPEWTWKILPKINSFKYDRRRLNCYLEKVKYKWITEIWFHCHTIFLSFWTILQKNTQSDCSTTLHSFHQKSFISLAVRS